ncbi:hypothetical protein BOTNAR_0722g00020 [Botryotinia narcissicola]|uniref:Uncharacterized protein n=1 Tax=Botryotinia narcissicola TaxID=278944 RepID=A0A4Z1H9N9_9HELO|nr:hypothetical protein BOTNAR_0722g00020 [Botryotinia narcissicola]
MLLNGIFEGDIEREAPLPKYRLIECTSNKGPSPFRKVFVSLETRIIPKAISASLYTVTLLTLSYNDLAKWSTVSARE